MSRRDHLPRRARPHARGVVLLALLIVMVLMGIGLMATVDVASLARQREQEHQLLFAGAQYREAIQRYYQAAPRGTPKVLPRQVGDLLNDDRFPVPVRHLRRAYPDPMSADGEWTEVRIAGRLAGVHSSSEREPIKRKGFVAGYEFFEGRASYREWVFAVSATGAPTWIAPAADSAAQRPGFTSDLPRSTRRTTP